MDSLLLQATTDETGKTNFSLHVDAHENVVMAAIHMLLGVVIENAEDPETRDFAREVREDMEDAEIFSVGPVKRADA